MSRHAPKKPKRSRIRKHPITSNKLHILADERVSRDSERTLVHETVPFHEAWPAIEDDASIATSDKALTTFGYGA